MLSIASLASHNKGHIIAGTFLLFFIDRNLLDAVDLQHLELIKLVVEVEPSPCLTRGHRWIPLHLFALAVTIGQVALIALCDSNKGTGMGEGDFYPHGLPNNKKL